MTQTTPLENGAMVLYPVFYGNGDMSENLDHKATIRGYTHFDDDLYYVLEGYSEESDEVMLFIRSHDQVRIDTSLSQYIGDYIELEVERAGIPGLNIAIPDRMGRVRRWIAEAIDAYEGGAR